MAKKSFEALVSENEADLQRIRATYFPLIAEGIITGYNLYPYQLHQSDDQLFVHYLHSDLKPQHRHYRELTHILREEGFLETARLQKRHIHRMERLADYLTKAEWEDPKGMRYFTLNGVELSLRDARLSGRALIGESLQHDLLIRVANEVELRKLIGVLKTYACSVILNAHGVPVRRGKMHVPNRHAVFKAWRVPLLFYENSGGEPTCLPDFVEVHQFDIPERLGNLEIRVCTLVKTKSRELRAALHTLGKRATSTQNYVLRVFIEAYPRT